MQTNTNKMLSGALILHRVSSLSLYHIHLLNQKMYETSIYCMAARCQISVLTLGKQHRIRLGPGLVNLTVQKEIEYK